MSATTTTPRAAELAPSAVRTEEPTAARMLALGGLLFLVPCLVALVVAQFQPVWLPPSLTYLGIVLGIGCLLYHAVADGDLEFRRAYGALAAVLLLAGIVVSLLPGKPTGSDAEKQFTYFLLPWGAWLFLLALLFLVPFVRHETDDGLRNLGLMILLATGATLAGGAVVGGIVKPSTLVGPGVVLGMLGVAFLAAYLSQVSADEGPGRAVALALGAFGAVALVYAVGRATIPNVLFEGPDALKNAFTTYDYWKVGSRAAAVLAFLGVAALGLWNKSFAIGVRGALVLVGVGFAGAFTYASVAGPVGESPRPYLVPGGLLLAALGTFYLAVSIGAASDSPFVTLVRRELAGFFYSPIAYIVLFKMTILQWLGYLLFVKAVLEGGGARAGGLMEPILQDYLPGTLIGPLVVMQYIPVLTMRLFSEEKRTGTMEVLLTAPVNETGIVLSKFLGTWIFYMLNWLPMGLYLIALRSEGGSPFDYKPLLSLYVAVAVSGMAFIAIGMFFSTLTKNQIVAAALTEAIITLMFLAAWHTLIPVESGFLKAILDVVGKLSYWELWRKSLGGQLLVKDLLVQASLAVFWLYITVKSVESRKWS